jgi:transcription antitermination factor NusG
MKLWHVIQSKPKKEKSVQEQLEKACFEVFLPMMQGPRSPKPLFPSYLFIRTDFQNVSIHRLIRFTRGVNRILGDGKAPLPVSDFLVETLKGMTLNGSLLEQDLIFKEGDFVTVKRGILKDLKGIIEKNLSDEGRVKVLFKWLHGCMRAILKYKDLEKAA